ncbi:acetolactate synthase small subunit [Balneolales bacterium ANBcel1]|nr:acetolactate synthase small subunit [Balneolales bacterium ANBcel1]
MSEGSKKGKKHTISMMVNHNFNALARIAGLFTGRGFNIDSISIGEAEEEKMASCTITTHGDERIIDQIILQLDKLVDVVSVEDLTFLPHVERELALIKVKSSKEKQTEIIQVANVFRAKVIDISTESLTIEITGRKDKVDAAIGMFEPFGIRQVARTGTVAMKREYRPKE